MITTRRRCHALAATTISALALLTCAAPPASASASTRLHLDLENGESGAAGSRVLDDSGYGSSGVVEVAYGGTLRVVEGVGGSRALRFPGPCSSEPCPNGDVRIPDSAVLDPGSRDFEWGAHVKLSLSQTTRGANVLQKGLYHESGGQWKLQVDGSPGRPSCLLSGRRYDGALQRTIARSSVSIADGVWRQVTCRRTGGTLTVLVDGIVRGSTTAATVTTSSSAPVTVGAKAVRPEDNDQFFGAVDEVFMRLR